jgi:hypothetical protein
VIEGDDERGRPAGPENQGKLREHAQQWRADLGPGKPRARYGGVLDSRGWVAEESSRVLSRPVQSTPWLGGGAVSIDRQFLDEVFGQAQGYAHFAVGRGAHMDQAGKYRHSNWEASSFLWPQRADEALRYLDHVLCQPGRNDLYVCPNLLATERRSKDTAVTHRLLHSDADGQFDPSKILALNGFAVSSGSPGHVHGFVPLAGDATLAQYCQVVVFDTWGGETHQSRNDPSCWYTDCEAPSRNREQVHLAHQVSGGRVDQRHRVSTPPDLVAVALRPGGDGHAAHRVSGQQRALVRGQCGVQHRIQVGRKVFEAVSPTTRDTASSMATMVERDHPVVGGQVSDLVRPRPRGADEAVRQHNRIAVRPENLGVQMPTQFLKGTTHICGKPMTTIWHDLAGSSRHSTGANPYFSRVNWLTSMYPIRNKSAQPIRYFM